jgi:hypothetical protein
LSHSTSPFSVMGFFKIGSCRTIHSPGWLWALIILIFASWVARITGVSHWFPFMLKQEREDQICWYKYIKI